MTKLSRLLLPLRSGPLLPAQLAALAGDSTLGLATMGRPEFDQLVALAHSNHVILRALDVFLQVQQSTGNAERAEWATTAMATEQARIRQAIPYLRAICDAFETEDLDVTVMKSLDHWPDLGSDLDLYTNAAPEAVVSLMARRFNATMAERSWGDRLAQKWNFVVPGLAESVEFHIGRLGQTGEQLYLAAHLPQRARQVQIDGWSFPVPHTSDRLMISTLQRMYRHFYFRLCDVIDSATLIAAGLVDFDDLQRAATEAGIWEGVATYLVIVSDYLKAHGSPGPGLPDAVARAARFPGTRVYFAREFIRVPIAPESMNLYRTQLAGLFGRGQLASGARLCVLPFLATAAFLEQKRTGSDKGIW